MATVRKYATLPDLDAAPDIYETPELIDDASTAVGTLRSDSRASSTAGQDDENSAIDRQRLDPNEARANFLATHSNEKPAYGLVGSRRAAYRNLARRIPNGTEEDGLVDSSDEADEESLDRKLARLRREVAEIKEAFEKRSEETKSQNAVAEDQEQEPIRTLDSLGQVLENIEQPQALDEDDSLGRLVKQLDGAYQPGKSNVSVIPAKASKDRDHALDDISTAIDHHEIHTLSRISDFDKRLRLLETALGMDSVSLPTQDRGASRAVLPLLDSLDRQVSTISMTESSLDKISRQIRQMTQDSEKLAEARKTAAAQHQSDQSSSEWDRISASKAGDRSTEDKGNLDQTSKINALYGTLSTIESLSPLIPSVLDRLQSLRAIHADAALASEALSKVETRQAAMTEELKEWNDGLEKVESAMQSGERSMKDNAQVVDGWVKELERRLQKTSPAGST